MGADATRRSIVYDYQIFGGQDYGGISRYFYELSRRLAEIHACRVRVLCPLYINSYFQDGGKLRPSGIRVPPFPWTGVMRRELNRALSCVVMPSLREDIVHETYYDGLARLPRGAARVVTVHDMIHERFPAEFSSRDGTSLMKARSVARADHVICISHATKRDLLEILKVPESKVSVVHNGCRLTDSEATPDTPRADRRPFILYVGARRGYKNFTRLLQAFATSQRLRSEFSILCFGGGELTAGERAMASGLGIPSDRLHHASGPDAGLRAAYRAAALLAYPSLAEGFGMPPLEAMSMGCPVACAKTPAVCEVVGDAAETFDALSIESMAATMERIACSTELRADLVKRGRERCREFSWERCASETLAVYDRVAAR